MTVIGSDGWLFLANELRHVSAGEFWGKRAAEVSRAARPADADPLPAILDFKRQLDELNIELILVPVPPKAVIYPDKATDAVPAPAEGAPERLDAAHQKFYTLLRDEGVNVLDLTDEFRAQRLTDEGQMYCMQDTHWSGIACNFAAERIAEIIKQRPWYTDTERQKFAQSVVPVEITGDLWQALDAAARPPKETLKLRMIGQGANAGATPVEPDRSSPVILLGDSHTLVFHAGGDMHASGAGLADQLAFELGFPVDLIGVRGSGATPARINLFRRGRSDADYFDNKRIIVWCFSAREFTESQGWRIVPVKR